MTFSAEEIMSCDGKARTTYQKVHSWETESSKHTEDYTYKNSINTDINASFSKLRGAAGFTLNNDYESEYQ